MKKIIAMLLALLMLLGTGALAEKTEAAMTLDNIVATGTADGQTRRLDLGDLSITMGIDADNPFTVFAQAEAEGETLALIFEQIINGQILLTAEGLEKAYAIDLPEEIAPYQAMLPMLIRQLIPVLDQVALPKVPGITVPKLDMRGLVADYVTRSDDTYTDFEVNYQQVPQLLNRLIEIGEAQGADVSQVKSAATMVSMLAMAGQGVNITGSIADSGDAQAANISAYFVEGGAPAQTPVATVNISSYENNFTAVFSIDEGQGMAPAFTVRLISDPAAARLDFAIDSANGQGSATFSVFPEDGLQKITLDGVSPEQEVHIAFAYGERDGQDLLMLSMSESTQYAIDFTVASRMDASGTRTGTVEMNVTKNANVMSLSADVTMALSENAYDCSGLVMPQTVVPYDDKTFEDEALAAILKPLDDYIAAQTVETVDSAA